MPPTLNSFMHSRVDGVSTKVVRSKMLSSEVIGVGKDLDLMSRWGEVLVWGIFFGLGLHIVKCCSSGHTWVGFGPTHSHVFYFY